MSVVRVARALFLGVVLALSASGPVLAGSAPSPVVADLEGRSIPAAEVSQHFCHDFAFPRVHCFTTGAGLDAAIAPYVAAGVSFVVVYDGTLLSGSYAAISSNQDALTFIGWNDRISSLRSVNGGAGVFWTDWFGGGGRFSFCCGSSYLTLGSFDNTFSSVYQS